MTSPILYDSHMHTPLCKHARGEPEEYAAVAEQRGLKGIIVTCHNPGPKGWSPRIRMGLEEFGDYLALVERARQEWAGRVDVRLGLESDFMPDKDVFPEGWNISRLLDDVRHSLDRIARTGVAMELNTSGLQKKLKEFLPGLVEMQMRDIPVVLGSDAHQPERVAADFDQALELLKEAGYDHVSFFLERQRQDVTLTAAQQSLALMSAGR